MGKHAQIKNVISPLYGPKGWAKHMVEHGKEFAGTRAFNTILSAIGALGTTAMCITVFIGWLSLGNNNTKDIQLLQGKVSDLTATVSKLADKMDAGPQSLQMHEFEKHLSALDGRMDGMDTRIGSDERALTKVQTQVDNIQSASEAQLRGHTH